MPHRTSTSAASNRVHRGGSLHISPLQSQTHSSKNYLILWLRISSPRCQVGRGEAKLEYDYIVVGVYMLFNRQSNCTGVLLDVPAHSYLSRLQVLSSLRAYLSTAQSLRISTRALSVRSRSLSVPFRSPFPSMRPCPGRLGRTYSIPILCGTSGPYACLASSRRTRRRCYKKNSHDTAFHPAEQNSRV